jgi:hypothetical protein
MEGARSDERTLARESTRRWTRGIGPDGPNEIIHQIALSCIDSRHIDGYRSGLNPEFLVVFHQQATLAV